jgi:hypothetical protein
MKITVEVKRKETIVGKYIILVRWWNFLTRRQVKAFFLEEQKRLRKRYLTFSDVLIMKMDILSAPFYVRWLIRRHLPIEEKIWR